jgi:carbohydrate kinase (thermoresistant glucokinase family)
MKAKDFQIILLMGVSSSGKTTIGNELSKRLKWPFFDGDSFHPPENIEKMKRGVPLDDQDRYPWLLAIRKQINIQVSESKSAIFACSALKERYREILMQGVPNINLIYLDAPIETVSLRANCRKHEYMPASLVESQFLALEIPKNGIKVSVAGSIEETVNMIMSKL